jgi:hypothetical protein
MWEFEMRNLFEMTTKSYLSRAARLIVVLAAFAFLATAPTLRAQKTSAPPPPTLTDDDSAVYTAVLRELYQAAKGRPIILSDQTAIGVPPGMLTNLPVQGPQTVSFLNPISQEARQSFEDLNHAASLHLPPPCKFAPECTLVDIADIALQVKNAKAWRKFMAKHANTPGIIIVSRIGFNRDRDQAVVYSGMSCGPLCGQGEFTWLTKHDTVWTVESSNVVWISTK